MKKFYKEHQPKKKKKKKIHEIPIFLTQETHPTGPEIYRPLFSQLSQKKKKSAKPILQSGKTPTNPHIAFPHISSRTHLG